MGGTKSKPDTVITTWKKHELSIKDEVNAYANIFIEKYCSTSPDDFTSDVHVLALAFDDYVKQYMAATRWDSYLYNTNTYTRFQNLIESRPRITLRPHNIVVGIKLLRWPTLGYQRVPSYEQAPFSTDADA